MTRIRKRDLILSLFIALLLSLSLAVATIRTARAEDPADVEITGFTRSEQQAFVKSEDSILGEPVEAWGCTGWGGFASILLTDTEYDVSEIWASGRGAISFWLYLDNEEVVAKHKEMGGTWNLDVSSSKSYSDSEKVCYALRAETFAHARVGWQRVVVPLADPNENNSMDWTKVSSLRLNTTGCGFSSGITIKVARFTFTTTDAQEPYIEDPADVELTFSASDDLVVTQETIRGESYTAYGSGAGWGSWLKFLTVADGGADVSEIAATGRGALAFWLYIGDEATMRAYREMGGGWNIDVCSAESYSDDYKYSFELHSLFPELCYGWNRIVLPFSAAQEKKSIDWHTVRIFRFNQTGSGLGGGQNDIKVAGISFTATDYDEFTIEPAPALSLGVKEVRGIVSDPVPVKQMEIEALGETVDAYYPEGWGGYVSLLVLDKAYSVEVNKSTALSVWVYFKEDADREKLSSFNIDVSSDPAFSDSAKYSFQLHKTFEMCKAGWNHVILPLEKAEEKNNMDWSSVQNIRLNVGGAQAAYVGTAKFEIVQSPCTEYTVEDYVPPVVEPEDHGNPRIPCEAETGLHIDSFEEGWNNQSDHNPTTASGYVKQGEGSWSLTGQGTTDFMKNFETPFDLSGYESISFWLYTDSAAKLAAMADGQIELRSAEGSDNNELHWDFKALAATLKDGWNYISLPFAEGVRSDGYDDTSVKQMRIYFIGLAESVTTVFDDLHAHKAPKGTLIESFDKGWNEMVEVREGHGDDWGDNLATNFSGEGWSSGGRMKFKNGRTVDIADYDMIGIWVYLATGPDGADSAAAVAGAELELSSSGTSDIGEINFKLPEGLQNGWQLVTFRIADGERVDTSGKTPVDLTKINFFGIVKTGLPKVTIYLDDLFAFESQYTKEAAQPIEKQTVVSADGTNAFNDTVLDNDEYMEGTGAAMSAEKVANGTFTALFGPVDTGLSLSGEKELGLALWVYVERASAVQSLSFALSSETGEGFSLSWSADVSALKDGWNWLTFRASEGSRREVIDLASVRSLTVSFDGDSSDPITIGFDCVRLVDASKDGAFDEVVDKQELHPVSIVALDMAEQEWDGAELSETTKKEGYASVVLTTEEETSLTATKTVDIGKTDLLVLRPRGDNELGVTMWIYAADKAAVGSVSFSLGSENGSLRWELGELDTGWNWIALRASEGTAEGSFDADGITLLTLTVTGNGFTVHIDRVNLVNYTVAENLTQPADEGVQRDPLREKIILNCDNVDGLNFTGNSVDAADMREGTGCVVTSGAGYQLVARGFDLGKTDLTKNTIVVAFWIWIEDKTLYESEKVDGQVELTSGGAYDEDEISWDIRLFTDGLENGWNWVALRGSDASVLGEPDFDAFNYFRLYINNIASSTLKLDRVTVGYVGNASLFEEPDWENELASAGKYQGANGSAATNPPYLDTDMSDPDEYEYTERTEVEVPADGCGASLGTGCAVLVSLLAAAALTIVLRRKEN